MIALCMAMIDAPEEKADFESLYRSYKGRLFALAYRILGNHHDAEEAVSQAFFTVARSFSRIAPLGAAQREAYLKIVTRNAAIDLYRREKRDLSFPLEEMDELSAVSDDVSDEVLSRMDYERVVEAIRALPERYAEPLYLFHVRELSVREIAAALHEREEAVKKQLQRARRKLRQLLEEKDG